MDSGACWLRLPDLLPAGKQNAKANYFSRCPEYHPDGGEDSPQAVMILTPSHFKPDPDDADDREHNQEHDEELRYIVTGNYAAVCSSTSEVEGGFYQARQRGYSEE